MISLLIFSICLGLVTTVQKVERPNIIFILADDVGWNEIGFNSDTSKYTPNIDALRREGASFTNFYAHAVCAPTRAAFLTGRYPFRSWTDWRSEDFGKPSYLDMLGLTLANNAEGEETRMIHGLDTDEKTIAEALAAEGYFTAITGKWHCGEWLPEHLPMGQGFMHQYGHYAWGIDYTNYTIPHNAPAKFAVYDWHRNQQPIYEQGYTTDLIANEVVHLLSTHRAKQGNQPFFYYVPFNAIHGPLEEIPRYVDQVGKRYAALKCLDDAIGRIVGALDQYGYADETLLVFTNDNGGIRENMNAPYRGTKNTNYEGGVRVPCVMRWPNHIQENSENAALMHMVDLYHTFIAIAGGVLNQERKPDGIDMSQTILTGQGPRRDEIVFEVTGSVRPPCIRQGDYKLIGEELFNIADDPYEQSDIASNHPEIVQTLRTRIAAISAQRPSLPSLDNLMSPALPWVYGQAENANAPAWLQEHMKAIRAKQPQSWSEGTTPWPQAPRDGKIIYTGDGR